MNRFRLLVLVAACGSTLAAAPAWTAVDAYLKIDGVEGESKSPAEPVAVAAWSFGASNPSTVRAVAPPREPATGQASGKRQPGAMQAAASTVRTLTVVVADSSDPTVQYLLRMCASGGSIPGATLVEEGQQYQLKDVVVTSCAASGAQRTLELRGHVTLIK
ncbi:MAG: hypothetical protein EPO25_08915 [Gammaproteobacteria bacterium]|nr:MAG: hypothetical protein EPO25_08915 [Gammaproteobacteria bacterium]